jgi:hypothetical protein
MGGNHATSDVFDARPLDRRRRPSSTRPAVQQQREHHRRLVGSAPMTVVAVGGIERRRIHHRHGVDDEPRQMVLRQPLPNVRRQQERLLTITRQEVLRHARNPLKPAGQQALCATASGESSRAPLASTPPLHGGTRPGSPSGALGAGRSPRRARMPTWLVRDVASKVTTVVPVQVPTGNAQPAASPRPT